VAGKALEHERPDEVGALEGLGLGVDKLKKVGAGGPAVEGFGEPVVEGGVALELVGDLVLVFLGEHGVGDNELEVLELAVDGLKGGLHVLRRGLVHGYELVDADGSEPVGDAMLPGGALLGEVVVVVEVLLVLRVA